MQYRIGIDLGGTAIKAGVVDENNQVVFSHTQPTGEGFEQVVADMAKGCGDSGCHGGTESDRLPLRGCWYAQLHQPQNGTAGVLQQYQLAGYASA